MLYVVESIQPIPTVQSGPLEVVWLGIAAPSEHGTHPLSTTMSASQPLLDTIEADEPSVVPAGNTNAPPKTARIPVVLTPTTRTSNQMATSEGDAESGRIFRRCRCYFFWINGSIQELEPFFDKCIHPSQR